MTPVAILPHLIAALNGLATGLLVAGLYFARRGEATSHRVCMLSTAGVSSLFLIAYLTLRFYLPITPFAGEGGARLLYYLILISHLMLAMVLVPLVCVTLLRGLKGRIEVHRAIARWTWPVWIYVSITGLLVYLMLYQIYPANPGTPG